MRFDAKRFVFEGYGITPRMNAVAFRYRTEFGDGTSESYVEKLTLPARHDQWPEVPDALRTALLETLHLLLGISYWKMYCPSEIELATSDLSTEQAGYWDMLYTKGLGEFFYKNKIDYRGLVKFPSNVSQTNSATLLARSERSLVPMGGGKDSLVTVESLRQMNHPFDLFQLNSSEVQDRVTDVIGKKSLMMQRKLDPVMIEKSRAGEVYNGHIPVTAMYSATALMAAVFYNYRYVVFSNERSANEGNVDYLDSTINHQWSKSAEAEQAFQQYVSEFVTPDVTIFSLLRPWSELEIVRRFCQQPKYFPVFSSCNRNFILSKPAVNDVATRTSWCGECPKCAFVFAMLCAFLPKERVLFIFGKNLFAQSELVPLYRMLWGKNGVKPFECVGTSEETMVALTRAHRLGGYERDIVMKTFDEEVLRGLNYLYALEQRVFATDDYSGLPTQFRRLFMHDVSSWYED